MATILNDLDTNLLGRKIVKTLFEPCRIILYLDNGDIIELEAINSNDSNKMYTDLNVKTYHSGREYNI